MLAVLGTLGGVVAGNAWAETSVFCRPGLLQGNPICVFLILFGCLFLGTVGLVTGYCIGWLLDGRPESQRRETVEGWQPGPATRIGAAIGTAVTVVLHLVWPIKPDLDVITSLALGLAGALPLAICVVVGLWIDRRR